MNNNNLRKLRVTRGLSQFDLAKKADITPSDISRLENNKIFPYPGWRERISKALNVQENDIWGEDARNEA